MTFAVAFLALTAAAAPLSVTTTAERVPLPVEADAIHLHVQPFAKRLVLEVPAAAVPAVAKRLRGASRLCPTVEAGPASVTLGCRSPKVRADLDLTTSEPTLDLRAIIVYPWRPEEEGPPLVPFPPERLGLSPCPGTTADARGECLLAAGQVEEARGQFLEALRGSRPSALAYLRLGDLALAEDDIEAALENWRRARVESPYGRLVGMRLCEMDPSCLKGPARRAIFDVAQVEDSVKPDAILRQARLRALEDDLAGAAFDLVPQMGPDGACDGALSWCRHLLLMVISKPGPDGAAALAHYLEMPYRSQGPFAGELLHAAADRAEEAGAPGFAANLLAAITGKVDEAALPAHLRRVAGLFLAAGDRARAEEIVLFARTHLDAATWKRDGWDVLQRGVRRPPPPPPPPPAVADPDLSAAEAAVEASRLLQLSKGARP